FDTLSWREPPVAARMATAGNGVEMLPLIIGRPAGAGASAPAADTASPETPAARPVPAPGPHPQPPAPEKVAAEVPVVRPGYIPRESDYAPSVTLTHREAPAPAPAPAPA